MKAFEFMVVPYKILASIGFGGYISLPCRTQKWSKVSKITFLNDKRTIEGCHDRVA